MGRGWFWVSYIAIAVMAALGLAAFIWYAVTAGNYIQTLSGVGPTGGEVTAVAGLGISILTNPAASSLTINNDGILTNTGVGPDAAGAIALIGGQGMTVTPNAGTHEITLATTAILTISNVPPTAGGEVTLNGGTAIGVVPNAGGNEITINNEGVTSLTAQEGIVGSGTTGDITIYNELVHNALLPFGDPNGPEVSYIVAMGFAIPENTWVTGLIPGFSPILLPGVSPGDGGVGNGGIIWTVPSVGEYHFSAGCAVFPSAIRADDYQGVSLAINLGGSTVDPSVSGYIPYGASMTMDMSAGGTNQPLVFRRFSVSGIVHAGCVGCPVNVGDALSIHIRQDHTGAGGAVTMSAVCRIQVAKSK